MEKVNLYFLSPKILNKILEEVQIKIEEQTQMKKGKEEHEKNVVG